MTTIDNVSVGEENVTKTLFSVQVPLTLTEDDLDNILTCCFEGGSNYWIESVEVVDLDYKGAYYPSEVPSRGGALNIYVNSGDGGDFLKDGLNICQNAKGWYFVVTSQTLMDGVARFAQLGRLKIDQIYEEAKKRPLSGGTVYTLDLDGEDADCILQLALFNAIIYG